MPTLTLTLTPTEYAPRIICLLQLSYNREDISNTELSDLRNATYLFTECVTKSCDSPDWLIQTCCQSASSRVTEMAYFTWSCSKCFQKCFSIENRIILSLNTVTPITFIV